MSTQPYPGQEDQHHIHQDSGGEAVKEKQQLEDGKAMKYCLMTWQGFSQPLWLSAQDLYKVKLSKIQAQME